MALPIEDRHAPPSRRGAETDAHVPPSSAIEIAEVKPWNVVGFISGGAAPPRPERLARLAIKSRDLGHGACACTRVLAHDHVRASVPIDIADGESRRRHRIRIERMNPAGLAVRERQDPQLRRARADIGLSAEQHDDFTIAATVKVRDLVNEANGLVRAPLVVGKEDVPNHVAVASGNPGQSVLTIDGPRPRHRRKVKPEDVHQE